MRIIPWTLPIKAVWTRALDLREQRLASRKLILILQEESGDLWQITFSPIQAFRVLTEECAASVLSKLPQDGGLFEVIESSWILELGDAEFLRDSRHYIVCCYDEVIEVVASATEANPAAAESRSPCASVMES